MNKDLMGTLTKIADTGYTWLEAASYEEGRFYGMAPEELKNIVENLGMNLISTHTGGLCDENIRKAADAAIRAGMKYLIMPSLPGTFRKSADGTKIATENFNRWGEICNSLDIKFGYHNHAFEFEPVESVIPYDYFLENTDPDLVTFQLDLYWIVKAELDPIDYFAKFPGRFELWHVKDMEDTEARSYTEVGNGMIDFKKIFQYKEKAGMKFFFVEQDHCRENTPLESIRISYDCLEGIL